MNIVDTAYVLALKHHKGQKYGSKPYIEHLADVVSSLFCKYGDESNDLLIATAWLHDAREDTDINPSEIVNGCGWAVLEAVEAMSKNLYHTYDDYIAAVRRNAIALEVKKHDTLCNLTASVMSGENGRIRKYAKQLLLLTGE